MYLEIFLADFAVFRVFLGISRDFAEIPEFRESATARIIRSPAQIKKKIKKRHLMNLFVKFHSTVLFSISFCVCRACFTHVSSSNLSCNICLWWYVQLILFNKGINADVYRYSLWEHSKRFHCSFEWHLTPHMMLSIETCIRQTPCIKRTLQNSPMVSN